MFDQSERLRARDGLGAFVDFQLGEDTLDVGLDRFRGDPERTRDFLIRLSLCNQLDDAAFPRAEALPLGLLAGLAVGFVLCSPAIQQTV